MLIIQFRYSPTLIKLKQSVCDIRSTFNVFPLPPQFFKEHLRQHHQNPSTTLQLLLRTLPYTIQKLHVMLCYPVRSTLLIKTTEEVEHSPHGNLHTPLQIRVQLAHEYLLLRCSQCHPDNVWIIAIHHFRYGRIVKVLHVAEGQLIECHVLDGRIYLREILFQGLQRFV